MNLKFILTYLLISVYLSESLPKKRPKSRNKLGKWKPKIPEHIRNEFKNFTNQFNKKKGDKNEMQVNEKIFI